ncbi:MAG TPA: sn-glycerol-3-phosphate ABC transporter substrate-binding protein UgpB [Burkholderiales bacterium]|nr:sn-glycerol-3-phosphate ABC transporter substrate-binding protein UgpB [Burkholderiales bacterium]
MRLLSYISAMLISGLAISSAHAATELEFWHSMDGARGEALVEVTDRFNAAQKDYKVVPVYKGSYEETAGTGLAATQAGKGPHILQVYDLGTANMITARQAYRPTHQVLSDAGEKLGADAYAPAASSYYSDERGNLMGLPFNVSTPVMFYNRTLFLKAGLDPNKPLTTWYDVQAALLKLQEAGSRCGLTTTWPSWTLVENTLAWHSEEFATRNNGFDGPDAQLSFNTRLAIRHISLLSSWLKSGIYTHAGRRDEGEALFLKGDCGMLMTSSASYANLKRNANFDFGLMLMPYYDDINKAPYNTSTGGAGLWAMAGKKPAEYRGVGEFFAYLAKAETQAIWHQRTGYLPLSRAAYDLTLKSGFYDAFPGVDVSIKQVVNVGKPTAYSRGVRLGNQAAIRSILDEELENVWALVKAPKQGLDDAVRRGNEVLRRFERGHKLTASSN